MLPKLSAAARLAALALSLGGVDVRVVALPDPRDLVRLGPVAPR